MIHAGCDRMGAAIFPMTARVRIPIPSGSRNCRRGKTGSQYQSFSSEIAINTPISRIEAFALRYGADLNPCHPNLHGRTPRGSGDSRCVSRNESAPPAEESAPIALTPLSIRPPIRGRRKRRRLVAAPGKPPVSPPYSARPLAGMESAGRRRASGGRREHLFRSQNRD